MKKTKSISDPNLMVISDEGWVEGWVSPATIDHAGEYVPPDAWDTSLHEKNPVALLNHKKDGPIVGSWKHPDGRYAIEKRQDGLWGRCYFNMGTQEGREEYASYRDGHKRAFSPGFIQVGRSVHGSIKGKNAKIVPKAILFEVSLVGLPENPEALATNCKSFSGITSESGIDGECFVKFGHVLELKKKEHGNEDADTEENEPESESPKLSGVRGYLDALTMVADVYRKAVSHLSTSDADADEKTVAQAKNLGKPFRDGVLAVCKFGKDRYPEMPWTECEAAVREAFGESETNEDEAVTDAEKEEFKAFLGELTTKAFDEKIDGVRKEFTEIVTKQISGTLGTIPLDVEKLKEVADNHETAIEQVVEVIEQATAS